MEEKNSKKKTIFMGIVIIVLAIALLCAILYALLKNKSKAYGYEEQRLQSLNTVIKDKNNDSNFGISEALEIIYGNGQDVVTRDKDYTYVWNKNNQEFEYIERAKLSTLGEEYQEMEIIDNVTEVKNACENGGIFYLDNDLVLTNDSIKTFSVKEDMVLVGGKNNIILSTSLDAIFSIDSENVNLTLYGMKLKGKNTDDKTGTNSGVCVNANNAIVNIYGCDFSEIAYSVNVRNYGNLTYKFTNGDPVLAGCKEDATCSVNVKNSKLNGKGCVNWKYVSGNCLIENCSLYSSDDWTLICLEGNGVNVEVKNCSLINTDSTACSGIIQCHAKNCRLNFINCIVGDGNIKTDEEMLSILSSPNSFGSEQDALDYSIYSGKAGGVYIDVSDDNWGVQEGNKILVNGQTVCENN